MALHQEVLALSESLKERHTQTFKKANYFINIPGKVMASNKISRPF